MRAGCAHPLAVIDELVPGFHRRAHVLLGHEEPVVREFELAACLADRLKVGEVLRRAVHERVFDTADFHRVREFLALQVHLVHSDPFTPHAEEQRRCLHLFLHFIHEGRLLLLRRREHRRRVRALTRNGATRVQHRRQKSLREADRQKEERCGHDEQPASEEQRSRASAHDLLRRARDLVRSSPAEKKTPVGFTTNKGTVQ